MAKAKAEKGSKIPPVPQGFKMMGKGNFPPVWKPENIGDFLQGFITQIKSIPLKKAKRKGQQEETRIMYVSDGDGVERSVWESVALEDIFNSGKAGDEVFIRYEGPIAVKGRKEPMKGFTTALKPKGAKK